MMTPTALHITIVYSNCDAGNEDGRGGVRCAAKAGGYCAAKVRPPIASFAMGGAREPKNVSVAHNFQYQIVLENLLLSYRPCIKT